MAEAEDSGVEQPDRPEPFLDVLCKSSGKIRRFSVGTEAGFAVNLINKKLISGSGGVGNVLMASHIEAIKRGGGGGGGGEEPVSFGHRSLLVDYGSGWRLQTVPESNGDKGGVHIGSKRVRKVSTMIASGVPFSVPGVQHLDESLSTRGNETPVSLVYIGKILFAFLLLFVFGAIFTLALENLPRLILYITSSL